MMLDEDALNDAKWAACNHRFLDTPPPSMEDASEAAVKAVRAYMANWLRIDIETIDAP